MRDLGILITGRTSQRDHGGIAFRELVEACHDPTVLFQPAQNALDDVALQILEPINKPGVGVGLGLGLGLGVLALVDKQPLAAST